MDKSFCTYDAGNSFTRMPNFDRRSVLVNLRTRILERLLDLRNTKRSVQATNNYENLKVYLYFSEPVLNSSAEILSSLNTNQGVLRPTNGKRGGNRRFGYLATDAKAADAKVRKRSNGKQGNIRSLLSTLQYVLWAESEWKPVPLVDIIEGNSVKRAYQKALLCLHPDKLQQKGAAPHQKYIAEKIFDILEDAWTHFNLVGGSF